MLLPITIYAQTTPFQVYLWENGAPGFEDRRNEPEKKKDWWIKNIHNPSITVFLPDSDKATGYGVVICPGGGFRELVFDAEGRDAATYLNSIGVAAFVLKYRLPNEPNSPYSVEKHVRQDAYRAMRLVRSNADTWKIKSDQLGIMGFSAGGAVAALIAYSSGDGDINAPDPVDQLNGKPDFQILIYPAPYGIPEVIPDNAPLAFLVAANDDPCCINSTLELLNKYHESAVPVSAHIYAQGGHAFNMGQRASLKTISTWPDRLGAWFFDNLIQQQ